MPKQPGMGVIAQEVEKVFPELVTTDELGRKKVLEVLIRPPVAVTFDLGVLG